MSLVLEHDTTQSYYSGPFTIIEHIVTFIFIFIYPSDAGSTSANTSNATLTDDSPYPSSLADDEETGKEDEHYHQDKKDRGGPDEPLPNDRIPGR